MRFFLCLLAGALGMSATLCYAGSDRSGRGTVTGRAYAIHRGAEHPASKETVELIPVNAYTKEIVERGLLAGRKVRADPRLAGYQRFVTSDANGNFVIRHVPAGEYFVISAAEWSYQYDATHSDNTGTDRLTTEFNKPKPVFTRIRLRADEAVRIRQWNQNCPDIGFPFAHG